MGVRKKLYAYLKEKGSVRIRKAALYCKVSDKMIRDLAITHPNITIQNYQYVKGRVVFVRREKDLILTAK